MLNLESLAAFVAIAEARNFSHAADRLGVVQSVVSKRLARLEDQLGTKLIDRSVRTDVRLTRIGEVFLQEARATLARVEATEKIGRNLARGTTGPLRLGFVFSAALNGTLIRLLHDLQANFPDLELQPRMMETPEQLAALNQGKLDIGLMRPREAYPAACEARVIHEEPLTIFLGAGHKLAATPRLGARQLSLERFIVPQFEEELVGLVESIERLARAGRFEMPEIIKTGDFVTAASLAAAGVGVALAPVSLGNLHLDRMVVKELIDYHDTVEMVMVHRRDAPKQPVQRSITLFDVTKRNKVADL